MTPESYFHSSNGRAVFGQKSLCQPKMFCELPDLARMSPTLQAHLHISSTINEIIVNINAEIAGPVANGSEQLSVAYPSDLSASKKRR